MTITVLAPAYYTSMYPVRYLSQSAKRYGIDIKWYGLGRPYPGWYGVQIIDLLEELSRVTTSHVLYTDASDALFLSDLEEIENKYTELYRPPILISRERSGVNAGGILAETKALRHELEKLRTYVVDDPDYNNPQVRWRFAIAEGYVMAEIDNESEIFQVVDEPLDFVNIKGGIYNPRTVNYPSILHFAGGFSHPEQGKAELIEPYWNKLGYNS